VLPFFCWLLLLLWLLFGSIPPLPNPHLAQFSHTASC
jgi:hypothetical protein